MCGGLFAGCDEAAGALVERDGKKYKGAYVAGLTRRAVANATSFVNAVSEGLRMRSGCGHIVLTLLLQRMVAIDDKAPRGGAASPSSCRSPSPGGGWGGRSSPRSPEVGSPRVSRGRSRSPRRELRSIEAWGAVLGALVGVAQAALLSLL